MNNNNSEPQTENEITVKIRTMDKEFEIKIKKTDTIKKLKEKIEEVTKKKIINTYNIFYHSPKKYQYKNKD